VKRFTKDVKMISNYCSEYDKLRSFLVKGQLSDANTQAVNDTANSAFMFMDVKKQRPRF